MPILLAIACQCVCVCVCVCLAVRALHFDVFPLCKGTSSANQTTTATTTFIDFVKYLTREYRLSLKWNNDARSTPIGIAGAAIDGIGLIETPPSTLNLCRHPNRILTMCLVSYSSAFVYSIFIYMLIYLLLNVRSLRQQMGKKRKKNRQVGNGLALGLCDWSLEQNM